MNSWRTTNKPTLEVHRHEPPLSLSSSKDTMNYWFTTHWPPQNGNGNGNTAVWVPDRRERAANDMSQGDYVAVYETKSGRTEVDKDPCKPGRQGMICYGVADSGIQAITDDVPTRYADGTEIWWRWRAPISICSRSGFVERTDVLRILGYNRNYNFRGFGHCHSGLKKISESEFKSLVKAFHASRPIQLPPIQPTGGGSRRNGGQEGSVHLNLKRYVASNPEVALKERGLRTLKVEYEFPTNDRADIVLVDCHERIIGLEIEPTVSDGNLVGLLQAIKYQYMLECFTRRERGDSRGILVAHEISDQVKTICKQYGIEYFEIPRNTVDSWAGQKVDESPVEVCELTIDNVHYTIDPPLHFDVEFDDEDQLYDLQGDFDVTLSDESRSELMAALDATLKMLWNEYALEDPQRLSPKGRRLRDEIRRRFRGMRDGA